MKIPLLSPSLSLQEKKNLLMVWFMSLPTFLCAYPDTSKYYFSTKKLYCVIWLGLHLAFIT